MTCKCWARCREGENFCSGKPIALWITAALPGMPCAQVRIVLQHRRQSTAYLLTVAAGVERRNLDGSPAGVPAEDQQGLAQAGRWPVEAGQPGGDPA